MLECSAEGQAASASCKLCCCMQVSQKAREAGAAMFSVAEQEVPGNLLQYLAWLRVQHEGSPPLLATQMPAVPRAAIACKVQVWPRQHPSLLPAALTLAFLQSSWTSWVLWQAPWC